MPVILRFCIVQYVSWCPYFMHCELNHVGPVTSDDATCFFSEMWVSSFAASCLSPPPLPSHSSHPCGGVVSGGGGVVGVPSTSEVAAYHARDTTATPAEGCVCCCTSPCASLCVLLCCVNRLSSLQHCSIPENRPPQSYKDCIQQLPAMDRSEAFGQHTTLTLQPDQGDEVHHYVVT